MSQASLLDWLGVDVWQLRVPPTVPPATPRPQETEVPASAAAARQQASAHGVSGPDVGRADTVDRRENIEPTPSPVSDPGTVLVSESEPSLARAKPVPSSRLIVVVPGGGAPPALLARIVRVAPRAVTVCTESTGADDQPLIRWQGQDWLLRDLQRDSARKRRLWRALCLPQSSTDE